MIRFYCERCGKELCDLAKWDWIKDYTLEQVKYLLICSDCLLAEIRKDRDEDTDEDRDS